MNIKSEIKREHSLFGFVKSNCFWRLEKSAFTSNDSNTEKLISIRVFMDYKTAKLIPTILKYNPKPKDKSACKVTVNFQNPF